jgi:hypothetical protein
MCLSCRAVMNWLAIGGVVALLVIAGLPCIGNHLHVHGTNLGLRGWTQSEMKAATGGFSIALNIWDNDGPADGLNTFSTKAGQQPATVIAAAGRTR